MHFTTCISHKSQSISLCFPCCDCYTGRGAVHDIERQENQSRERIVFVLCVQSNLIEGGDPPHKLKGERSGRVGYKQIPLQWGEICQLYCQWVAEGIPSAVNVEPNEETGHIFNIFGSSKPIFGAMVSIFEKLVHKLGQATQTRSWFH